jgi:SAM-dependent methyltransferase
MFKAYGHPPRYNAQCGDCGAMERHRLFALFLRENPRLGTGIVIHFAPESYMQPMLRLRADSYRSADLYRKGVDMVLNIERLDLPDESIDLFLASHILEHVDDRMALMQMHRCLKPGGSAIIMVPIVEGWDESYEDSSITTEKERERHFGQKDHVRLYGRDLRDRIQEAGFELAEFTARPSDTVKYALSWGEKVFVAQKPYKQLPVRERFNV